MIKDGFRYHSSYNCNVNVQCLNSKLGWMHCNTSSITTVVDILCICQLHDIDHSNYTMVGYTSNAMLEDQGHLIILQLYST